MKIKKLVIDKWREINSHSFFPQHNFLDLKAAILQAPIAEMEESWKTRILKQIPSHLQSMEYHKNLINQLFIEVVKEFKSSMELSNGKSS